MNGKKTIEKTYYYFLKNKICDLTVIWVNEPSPFIISVLLLKKTEPKLNEYIKEYLLSLGLKNHLNLIQKRNNIPGFVEDLINEIKNYFEKSQAIKYSVKNLFLDNLSPFQKNVLLSLKEVPFGTTISYKQLAVKSGYSKAYRAVGNAMNKNPFPLIFPCHRVIKNNGLIGGFALGDKMKSQLLMHEKTAKIGG